MGRVQRVADGDRGDFDSYVTRRNTTMKTRTTPISLFLISLACLLILLGLAIKLYVPAAEASSAPSKPTPEHALPSEQATRAAQVPLSAPLCGPNWTVSQSPNAGTSNNYLTGVEPSLPTMCGLSGITITASRPNSRRWWSIGMVAHGAWPPAPMWAMATTSSQE